MNKIKDSLKENKLNINDDQIEKLYHFYKLVVEYNESVNLTAITDYEEFIQKHFTDSLYFHILNKNITNKYILDLGTGGGFPGIPLAITCPDCSFVLLDSLNKRIHFLEKAVAELSLDNVLPFHGRAEESAHDPKYREAFDICVSRAVANLSTLAEYALPFVKVDGSFISYKGDNIEEEVSCAGHAIEVLGGVISEINKYNITGNKPENTINRSMIKIKKTSQTPDKYPRRAGVPSKKPL